VATGVLFTGAALQAVPLGFTPYWQFCVVVQTPLIIFFILYAVFTQVAAGVLFTGAALQAVPLGFTPY
jgi:hypothetical protein